MHALFFTGSASAPYSNSAAAPVVQKDNMTTYCVIAAFHIWYNRIRSRVCCPFSRFRNVGYSSKRCASSRICESAVHISCLRWPRTLVVLHLAAQSRNSDIYSDWNLSSSVALFVSTKWFLQGSKWIQMNKVGMDRSPVLARPVWF